jgi:hypothetical protein
MAKSRLIYKYKVNGYIYIYNNACMSVYVCIYIRRHKIGTSNNTNFETIKDKRVHNL